MPIYHGTGKNNANWKGGKTKFICNNCGDSFSTYKTSRVYDRKFCSLKCSREKISQELKGENAPSWKGGRLKKKGYWYIHSPNHPDATKQGYVAEHRLVLEKKLDRRLKKNEHSHHLNGIRTDNRSENLELMDRGKHTALHHKTMSDDKRKERSRKISKAMKKYLKHNSTWNKGKKYKLGKRK